MNDKKEKSFDQNGWDKEVLQTPKLKFYTPTKINYSITTTKNPNAESLRLSENQQLDIK